MNLFTKSKLTQVIDALETCKKISIVAHYNPDGDAIGAALALYHYFNAINYDVQVIMPNPFPQFLHWMPGSDQIIIAEKHLKTAKKILNETDFLFVVDMNAPHRAGKILEDSIAQSPAFKVLIDHHISPEIDCNVAFSNIKTTSTCELVYQFITHLAKNDHVITKEIAECIYVGMLTDTGSFSYMCNNAETYVIVSKLMKKGINGEQIHRAVYDNYSESRLKLLGLCLGQRLTVLKDVSTSYMYLTKQDLKDNNYAVGDTEGFVNYGISMKGIQFTAFFIERDTRIRISFRSKGNFDVNTFARKHFNGGGHKNAAGADSYDTLEETIRRFNEIMKQYKDVLDPSNIQ